jgi:TerC family integral membrane protein
VVDSIWLWVGFNAAVVAMLALDLGVFHRKAHAVGLREAAAWSAVWVTLALAFNAAVWHFAGPQPALEFLTGYLVEKSLAVDNIFVIALIFSYFAVPAAYQHRVLFWGILGALVMRGAFIAAGAYVLHQWHWVIYVFGGVLLLTGVKLALRRDEAVDLERNRWCSWRAAGCRLRPATTGSGSGRGRTGGGWRPRSSWCCCWWSSRTWCSPSTASRRSSRLRTTRSSSTRPT